MLPRGGDAVEVVGMYVELPVPALFRRARHPRVLVPTLVVVIDVTIRPSAPDEVRHRVGNRPKLLSALPQLLFLALAFGDIEGNARDTERTPRVVVHRAAGTEQPRLSAFRVEHTVLGPELALIQCALHVSMHARPVGRVHPIEKSGQVRRRIRTGANEHAESRGPVTAVTFDFPLPHPRVDALLCDVQP